MELITVIGIGIGLAADAFAVAVANGMAVCHLRFGFAVKQGFLFGFWQGSMPIIGWLIGSRLSDRLEPISGVLAFVILCIIGIKMCVETVKKNKNGSNNCPILKAEPTFRILVVLSIATSIDALAVGVTFACSNVEKFSQLAIYSLIIGAITFLMCTAGAYIGRKFGDILKGKSEIIGGLVLIAIAFKLLYESL